MIPAINIISIILILTFGTGPIDSNIRRIDSGHQPQITIDREGVIRIVYGREDSIFCVTSTDNGRTFNKMYLGGKVNEMHLGMSRGPQFASSKDFSMVTAMDKSGNIHSFQLDHKTGVWSTKGLVNDISGSAPEGLMSLANDSKNNFYAVWLDTRGDRKNKIYYSRTTDQGMTWTKNQLVYTSPEGTVCECCKPSIAVNERGVYIMFRNWLNGSRDLYLLSSDNSGDTFKDAIKLGNGTWKLNACPMDGGGLIVNEDFKVSTFWQRNGEIFYSVPNQDEIRIGTGRNCNISDPSNPILSWQDGEKVKLLKYYEGISVDVGEGSFLKSIRTTEGTISCTWENNDQILFRII